jgi:hypothetical protein
VICSFFAVLIVLSASERSSDKGNAGGSAQPVGLARPRPAGVDHVRGRGPPPCPGRRDAQRERAAVVDQLVQGQQINGTEYLPLHRRKSVLVFPQHFQLLTRRSSCFLLANRPAMRHRPDGTSSIDLSIIWRLPDVFTNMSRDLQLATCRRCTSGDAPTWSWRTWR